MGAKRVRDLWAQDKPAWGIWVSLADPGIVEIAGYAGFDYVAVDLEHTALDLQTVENMIRAGNASSVTTMVRVPENNPKMILRVVELGPDGIMIPHIVDAADARKAVEAAKYRPIGDRGMSALTRAAHYGAHVGSFLPVTQEINRDLIVYCLIEEKSAADDIEAIASVEGIDVCGIAPADLVRSLGCMESQNDPRAIEVIERIAAMVKKVGKAKLAIPAFHPNFEVDSRRLVELGARMISCGQDTVTLYRGFRDALQRAKKTL